MGGNISVTFHENDDCSKTADRAGEWPVDECITLEGDGESLYVKFACSSDASAALPALAAVVMLAAAQVFGI